MLMHESSFRQICVHGKKRPVIEFDSNIRDWCGFDERIVAASSTNPR